MPAGVHEQSLTVVSVLARTTVSAAPVPATR